MNDLSQVLEALYKSEARYLVVGGVAVVLHGHPRFTADLDLVLALDEPNVRLAMKALQSLGYRPRAPVGADDFANRSIREEWIRDKNLTVFSMWSGKLPATEIDIFVREPFEFDDAYARALSVDLPFARVSVASLDDLIALKKAAGRPKDLEDIAALEKLRSDDV